MFNVSHGVYLDLCTFLHDAAGDVEVINGIEPETNVKLVDYLFPTHLQFLELIFIPGSPSATVRTKEALDADVLVSVSLANPFSQ